ncbi:MAG: hypothetical protein ACRDF4_08685 [Rhabdochlamydiaceae bacterium]
MSLELVKLTDLKSYVENYLGVPVFYERTENHFAIRAGHSSWKGVLEDEKEATKLAKWLLDHGAKQTKGYIEDQELFS